MATSSPSPNGRSHAGAVDKFAATAPRTTPAVEPRRPSYCHGVPSESFLQAEEFVRRDLVEWYRSVGDVEFAFAAGSLVEGFTEDADLDLTFVWTQAAPAADGRLPAHKSDSAPTPQQFQEPNFNLDRFWAEGQQFDVKHVALDEFLLWVEGVDAGRGFTGYPMPVIVMHALTTGVVVFDEQRLASELRDRLTPPGDGYVMSSMDRWFSARRGYLDELEKAVERGDGLLFDGLAVEAVRLAFIAWFAGQGRYWPHEKRLSVRLRRMGFDDLAASERRVWSTAGLAGRLTALRSLLDALFPHGDYV